MKIFLSIILVAVQWTMVGQRCTNVIYSNSPQVSIHENMYVVNCEKKVVDTSYEIKVIIYSELDDCYQLYHKEENWLIKERWTSNDTIYHKEYYRSGKIKRDAYFYDYRTSSSFNYYENGQIAYGGIATPDALRKRQSFYEDGTLRQEDYYYAGSVYDSIYTYHPNGKIASKLYYTPFTIDLLVDSYFKLTEEKASFYFDPNGDTIPYPQNESINVNTHHYPSLDVNSFPINGNIYSFYQITNQDGYDHRMSLLKKKILKKLKLPKDLHCPIAYCDFQLMIDTKGNIDIEYCSFKNEILRQAFFDAIHKLGKWEVGKVDNTPVNVLVCFDIMIENVP